MLNLLALARNNYLILLNRKTFVFSVFLLIITALFIIPKQNADYVTFYIGNYTGYPNDVWVGSLGSVLSNLILSFVGFFFLEGIYKEEMSNGVGILFRTSPLSKLKILFVKWFSYALLLFTYQAILIIVLYIINAKSFNIIRFLTPFLFNSFPYLLLLTAIIIFFDFVVLSRGLKIAAFIILILVAFTPIATGVFDIIGINHLVRQTINQMKGAVAFDSDIYGVGYRKVDKITYAAIQTFNPWGLFIYYRFILIGLSLLVIYFSALLFNRYAVSKNVKAEEKSGSIIETIDVSNKKFQFQDKVESFFEKSVLSLTKEEFIILKGYFSKNLLWALFILFICCLTVGHAITAKFLVPGLFLLSFSHIENYINLVNRSNMQFFQKISVYSDFERNIAKILVLTGFYTVCLIPVLIYNNILSDFKSILYMVLLSLFSIMTAQVFKNVKLLEIIYIIIFGSYIAGSPVINLY